ncbi:MAG: tryptophan--tRNA ligase [Candidatus Hydrothermarchaeota archaeon]
MRIDPWGSDVFDYARLRDDFGIEPFEPFEKKIKNPHHLMRRGIVFGQRGFKIILDALNSNSEFVVLTGMMPSGRMHIGHKMVVDQIIWYQERGAEICIPIADFESYATRNISLKEAESIAIQEYVVNYIALGLKPKKCRIYFQSKNDRMKDFAFLLARKINLSEMRAIYGFSGETNISHLWSPIIQVSDILHPQLDGPKPTVVPVGVDQDPHIRLTRDVASRYKDIKLIPPASTYHRFMTGLTGQKMSSSDPKSAIFLTDTEEEVIKKIWEAKTGGRETTQRQKELGGIPEECMIYELYLYHLVEDDNRLREIYEECKAGSILCGDCKDRAFNLIIDFLNRHKERREQAKNKVEDYLEYY